LRFASDPAGEEPLSATVPLGASSVTFENVLFDGLSGEAGGDVTITATVAGPGGTVTGTSDAFSVRDVTMEVTTDRTSLPANGADTARITVRLARATGVGVAGETIRIATTLGTFVDGATALGQTVERTTNAEGVTTVDLRASRQVGTAVVTALCPGACPKAVEVAFVGVNTDPLVIAGDGVAWLYPPSFDVATTGVTYRVGMDGEPVTIDAADLRIPIRIDDLENGVADTVEVRGETASGSLPWSEPLQFTPGTVTAPLVQLRIVDGLSGPFKAESVADATGFACP
jgi:Bacterial Ig-like domain (group 1).